MAGWTCPTPDAWLHATRAAKALDNLQVDNADQRTGVEIIRRAIETSARQIAENAGTESSIIVGKLRGKSEFAWGWNTQTNEFGDLYSQGVIDPAKVVGTALQDAASFAGLLVATEAMMAEKPKKVSTPAMPAMPAWTSDTKGASDALPQSRARRPEDAQPMTKARQEIAPPISMPHQTSVITAPVHRTGWPYPRSRP